MNRFAYATASSLSEALAELDALCRPLAGGTDLIGLMKEGLVEPEKLINLKEQESIASVARVDAPENGEEGEDVVEGTEGNGTVAENDSNTE